MHASTLSEKAHTEIFNACSSLASDAVPERSTVTAEMNDLWFVSSIASPMQSDDWLGARGSRTSAYNGFFIVPSFRLRHRIRCTIVLFLLHHALIYNRALGKGSFSKSAGYYKRDAIH